MFFLKQSTPTSVKIGPFVDEDDGKTDEILLTLTQADIRLSKNGGNYVQKTDAGAATTDELGYYDCPLDATDTGTCGRLKLAVHEAGALPVWHEFTVVNANVFDSLFAAAATDYLQVDTLQLGGSTQSATDLKDFADTGYNPVSHNVAEVDVAGSVTGAVGSVAGAVGSVAGNVDGNVTGTIGGLAAQAKVDVNAEADTALSDVNLNHLMKDAVANSADMTAEVADGTVLCNLLSATSDTSTYVVSTDSLQAIRDRGDAEWITAVGFSTLVAADVNAEVDTALSDINLDHLMKTAVANNADMTAEVTNGTVLSNLMSATSTTNSYAVADDSLEAIRDRGDAEWITAVGFSVHTAANVWAVAARTLTAATNITSTGATLYVDGSGYVQIEGTLNQLDDLQNISTAQVNTEVDTALSDINLNHLMKDAVANNADMTAEVTNGTVLSNLMSATSTTNSYAVADDSLEAIRDRGDAEWITAVGFSTLVAADVNAEVDTALSDINLNHLMKDAVANNADMTAEVTNGTVISNMLSKTSTTNSYVVAADSFEALRDRGDAAWTTGGGTGLSPLASGTATAGGPSTITLAVGSSAVNDLYVGAAVVLHTGTGAGQLRTITAYAGGTRIATVDEAWLEVPDFTSQYELQAVGENGGGGGGDSPGVVTLLARLTAVRAALLDNLANLTGVPLSATADIDSTGTEAITVIKALEVLIAYAIGDATYDGTLNRWTLLGRDGTTAVGRNVQNGGGNRSDSEVL